MAVVANLDAILGAKTEEFTRSISGAIVPVDQLQKELKDAGLTQREWNSIVKEGARVSQAVRTPLEVFQQEIRDLDRLLKAGLIDQEAHNRAVRQATAAHDNATGATAAHNAVGLDGTNARLALGGAISGSRGGRWGDRGLFLGERLAKERIPSIRVFWQNS